MMDGIGGREWCGGVGRSRRNGRKSTWSLEVSIYEQSTATVPILN